jgi:hypothetical protein
MPPEDAPSQISRLYSVLSTIVLCTLYRLSTCNASLSSTEYIYGVFQTPYIRTVQILCSNWRDRSLGKATETGAPGISQADFHFQHWFSYFVAFRPQLFSPTSYQLHAAQSGLRLRLLDSQPDAGVGG